MFDTTLNEIDVSPYNIVRYGCVQLVTVPGTDCSVMDIREKMWEITYSLPEDTHCFSESISLMAVEK